LQFAITKGDKKLKIHSIQGVKSFKNFETCEKTQAIIIKNFDSVFSNNEKVKEKFEHPGYKGTGTFVSSIGYALNDKSGAIEAACYHFKGYVQKKFDKVAELRVAASKKNFYIWLLNEAYK